MNRISKFMKGNIRVFGSGNERKTIIRSAGTAAVLSVLVAVAGVSHISVPPEPVSSHIAEDDGNISFNMHAQNPITGQSVNLNGRGTPEAVERVKEAIERYGSTGDMSGIRTSMKHIMPDTNSSTLLVMSPSPAQNSNLQAAAVGLAAFQYFHNAAWRR